MRKAWCTLREHVTNVHLYARHMVLMFLKVPETPQRHTRRMAAQPGTKAPSHPSLSVWALSSVSPLVPTLLTHRFARFLSHLGSQGLWWWLPAGEDDDM